MKLDFSRGMLIAGLAIAPACVPAAEPSWQGVRQKFYAVIVAAAGLDADRQLAHLSHVCSLRIDGKWYPVLDVQEIVKGATTPRGYNRIIVLSPGLKPVQQIEYTAERPLFCSGNRLFVWGDLAIANVEPAGNVLTFTNRGHDVSVSRTEANDVPAPKPRKGGAIQ